MTWTRRNLLKTLGAGGSYIALAAAGLVKPLAAFAADWNKAAFEAKDMPGALAGLHAGNVTDSADVVIKAPSIAENGAVVPVEIVSKVPNTSSISVFVDGNVAPLAGHFTFTPEVVPEVSVRLKFAKTSNVRAVVMAGGKAYGAQSEVKVTTGGCGG